MVQKYGNIDADDIRMKMDIIKQEPKERVQKYFERLDRLFQRGRISDVEQRRRFLARLRPEIRKLCVVRVFADIEELVATAIEVERVLAELGETPYEPLRDEQEEEALESNMENPVVALNNALINFLRGRVSNPISSFSPTLFIECQICGERDHIAMTCPRSNEPRPKCANRGMPHRTKNCGVKCPLYSGIGHSGDRCLEKHNEGRSHFEAANFREALFNGEEATATIEDLEVKCLTKDGPGIWEEEKSPRLALFLNTLASSEDHGYLGLGSFGKTEVVQRSGESILHKQELDRDEPADEERDEGNAFNVGDDGTEKETCKNDLDSGEHMAEEDGGFQGEEEDQDTEVAEHKRKATDSDDRDLDQQQEDAGLQQGVGMDSKVVRDGEERNNRE